MSRPWLCYDSGMLDHPPTRKLSYLLQGANAAGSARENVDVLISGIAYDSRKVKPGDLFVAVSGSNFDGHRFLGEAASRGAAAALVEKEATGVEVGIPLYRVADTRSALAELSACFYDYPSENLSLVGITGTNGKTTTAYLLREILDLAGLPAGLISTVEYRFGSLVLPAPRTTPESLDLQKALRIFLDRGARSVAMEASSHSLEQGRLRGCRFSAAVFTNLSPEHLDYHGSMEDYFLAKRRLFDPAAYRVGRCVVNIDDKYGRRLAGEISSDRLVTYGQDRRAKVRLLSYGHVAEGLAVTVSIGGREFDFFSPLRGFMNAENILAAVAAAIAMEVGPKTIRDALQRARGARGRFDRVDRGQDFEVIVDYAHTPDGLEKVLNAARELGKGRLIVVFGCGGDRDKKKRPLMGSIASRLSDVYVLTSDNPRGEPPERIMDEVMRGTTGGAAEGHRLADRREAIAFAINAAGSGDTVVIAGKGHETGQIFADRTLPFDDLEVARELLDEKMKGRLVGNG